MKSTVALLAIGLLLAVWLGSRGHVASVPRAVPAPAAPIVGRKASSVSTPSRAVVGGPEAADFPASRADLVAYLRPLFRAKQLSAELALDQRRYADSYWQPDVDGPSLRRLDEERMGLRARLAAELNALADELFPDPTAAPLTLEPLFDADHPAPNVRFLSAASRQKFEAALLAAWETRGTLAGDVVRDCAGCLAGAEREAFQQWNSAPAAAWREQLAGFGADQHEFDAILRSMPVDADGAPTVDAAALIAELGPERFAQWEQFLRPDVQTARRDLRAVGGPPDQAAWLARARQEAGQAFALAWSDTRMPDTARAAEVAQLRRDYAEAIAAQAGLPGHAADEVLP